MLLPSNIEVGKIITTPAAYGTGVGFSRGSEGPSPGTNWPVDAQSIRVTIYDQPANLIGHDIMPIRMIDQEDGYFTHVSRLSTNVDSNIQQFRTSPNTKPQTAELTGLRGYFSLESHSLGAVIPMLTLKNSAYGDTYPEVREMTMRFLRSALATKRELACAEEVFKTTNYHADYQVSNVDFGGSSTNIMEAIHKAMALRYPSGMRPNTLVMGKNVETDLLTNSSIIEASPPVLGAKTRGMANLPEFFSRFPMPLRVMTFDNYTIENDAAETEAYIGANHAALVFVGEMTNRVRQGPDPAVLPGPGMLKTSPLYGATFGFTAMLGQPEAFEMRQLVQGGWQGQVYLQARETYKVVVTNIPANTANNVKAVHNRLGYLFVNASR